VCECVSVPPQGRRAVSVTLHGGTANNTLGVPLTNWSRSATLATGVEAVQVRAPGQNGTKKHVVTKSGSENGSENGFMVMGANHEARSTHWLSNWSTLAFVLFLSSLEVGGTIIFEP